MTNKQQLDVIKMANIIEIQILALVNKLEAMDWNERADDGKRLLHLSSELTQKITEDYGDLQD